MSEWSDVEYHEFPEEKVDFDKTPVVEGTLIWRETVATIGLNSEPREATMYAIADADGVEVGVWGTANLDAQLRKVPDGAEVRIEYVDTKKIGGGKQMRRFHVQTRPAQ